MCIRDRPKSSTLDLSHRRPNGPIGGGQRPAGLPDGSRRPCLPHGIGASGWLLTPLLARRGLVVLGTRICGLRRLIFPYKCMQAPVVAVSCAAARAGSSVDGFDGHLRHRAARLQHAEPAAVAALHPSTGYLTPSGLRIGSGGTADEVGLVLDNGN